MAQNRQQPEDDLFVSDEKLEEIYGKLVQEVALSSEEEQVRRAREALQLIERVREAANKETPRVAETRVDQIDGKRPALAIRDVELPEKIGRFEIQKMIGQGGFGMVFLAHDPNLARNVALKIPRPEAITTADSKARFLREGRAAAALAHPNIVPVYESGQIGAVFYLASQYVDGVTLDDWAKTKTGPVSDRKAATICRILAEALAHAHQRGVIHRDIKPANVLIRTESNHADSLDDRIQITDFGLAKNMGEDSEQTHSGALIGTPSFMSTEQAQQTPASAASDVYSAGAVMYWLLTGQPPFSKPNIVETIQSIIKDEPVPPRKINSSIPADLEAICLKCLEKHRGQRYATASDLQRDLSRFLDGEPVLARSIGSTTRFFRWCRRNQLATALVVVLAISAITVSALLYRSEGLRSLSESRALELNEKSLQLQTKTLQLQDTIKNLFVAVAESPEIMTPGNEPLRKRLMQEADDAYSQIDDSLLEGDNLVYQKLDTKLKFALLSFALGEQQRAEEINDNLLERLNHQLLRDEFSEARHNLLLLKTSALILKLKILAGDDQTEPLQETVVNEVLELVDGELQSFGSNDAELVRAQALADLAENRMFTNATLSVGLGDRAREIWQQIPIDEVSDSQEITSLVSLYRSAIQSLANSEDSEKGLESCQEFFAIYDRIEANDLPVTPLTRMYLADIYKFNAFLLRDTDIQAAIAKSEHGNMLSARLADQHPLIGVYAANITSHAYKLGLLQFIAKNYDQSETTFLENIELCENVLNRFPDQSRTARLNMGYSLTMLGLIYRNREQWLEQIDTLEKSREMNNEFLQSGRPQFVVDDAGLVAGIALAHSRLGEHELAQKLIQQSIEPLETILAADPKNGEAKRFLSNNVNRAIQINRRAGDFEIAGQMLDNLVDILGGELKTTLLPHAIEIEIAIGDLALARGYIDAYENESEKLNADQLKFDASQFCWSLRTLQQKSDNDSESNQALRDRLIDVAVTNLAGWLEASDDSMASFSQIVDHPDFVPLHEEPAFLALDSIQEK